MERRPHHRELRDRHDRSRRDRLRRTVRYPAAANGTVGRKRFFFTRLPPNGGRLVHDFLAVITFGGVRASVEVRGETPIIRCEGSPVPLTQRVCKFAA
jgi:hypothetical protein